MRTLLLTVLALNLFSSAWGQEAEVMKAPPAPEAVQWGNPSLTKEGRSYKVVFRSPLDSDYPVNDLVTLRVLIPESPKPLPCVLILHYWGATDLKLESQMARGLARKGIASAIMTLPYHLDRTPKGFRSGALAVTPDLNRLKRTLVQAVQDARRSLDVLATRHEIDPQQFGLAGTSLGAITGSLVLGVEPRIQHAALLLGGADLAKIIWFSSRVVNTREALRRDGYTEDSVREALTSVEPLRYLGQRPHGSPLVVIADYDTVIPEAASMALVQALPQSKVVHLSTGHFGGVLVQNQLLEVVGGYFEAQFWNSSYNVPRSIAAPTIRLGAQVTTGEGFDISVGLDFLKRKQNTGFGGTFLLSPRGPRLFFGSGIDRTVSAGLLISSKRVGACLLWSVVL